MDAIEAIKNFPFDRLVVIIKTDDGNIKIETTKDGAVLLIRILRLHTRAVKEEGGFDIDVLPKTEQTADEDFILERFIDREGLLAGAVKKAIASDSAEERMYF